MADGEHPRDPWRDGDIARFPCLDVDGLGKPGRDCKCSTVRREEAESSLDDLEDIGGVRTSCANGTNSGDSRTNVDFASDPLEDTEGFADFKSDLESNKVPCALGEFSGTPDRDRACPVSYTHLTLPTT